MIDTLLDIRSKLKQGAYTNEEQVRFSLVGRILRELGWDTWNPKEVFTEFPTLPEEDKKKVDIALFSTRSSPSVFIEVKSVGKVRDRLGDIERQLRDYNRNITAPFCIITDGREWLFYYSQTGGSFGDKQFESVDLLDENIDANEVKALFEQLLSKQRFEEPERGEKVKREAEKRLRMSRIQKAMARCLPEARRMTQQSPFPTLPDALLGLTEVEVDSTVSREQVVQFIEAFTDTGTPVPTTQALKPTTATDPDRIAPSRSRVIGLEEPIDLRFTRIIEASIGDRAVKTWNDLVRAAVEAGVDAGHSIREMQKWAPVRIKSGTVTDDGFHPIPGRNLSVPGVSATHAWSIASKLAQKLNLPIRVQLCWRDREGAAFPGEQATLEWPKK